MDVDYDRSVNKHILSSYCVPSSVFDHMVDKGYFSQSIRGDETIKLYVIETKTVTGGIKMGQDV